jgi:hypothetical protein
MSRTVPTPSPTDRDATNFAIAESMRLELESIEKEYGRLKHELAELRSATSTIVASCLQFELRRSVLRQAAEKLGITLEQ